MEDAHTQLLSLNNDKNSAFFAVYDGHGGNYNMLFMAIVFKIIMLLKVQKSLNMLECIYTKKLLIIFHIVRFFFINLTFKNFYNFFT